MVIQKADLLCSQCLVYFPHFFLLRWRGKLCTECFLQLFLYFSQWLHGNSGFLSVPWDHPWILSGIFPHLALLATITFVRWVPSWRFLLVRNIFLFLMKDNVVLSPAPFYFWRRFSFLALIPDIVLLLYILWKCLLCLDEGCAVQVYGSAATFSHQSDTDSDGSCSLCI